MTDKEDEDNKYENLGHGQVSSLKTGCQVYNVYLAANNLQYIETSKIIHCSMFFRGLNLCTFLAQAEGIFATYCLLVLSEAHY